MSRSLGGPGDMNMPYEDDPEALAGQPMQPDLGKAQLAGGLVMLAVTLDHPVTNKRHPGVIFRFSHPEGDFYEDIVLVVEVDELEQLKKLTADTIDGAKRGAELGIGGGGRG